MPQSYKRTHLINRKLVGRLALLAIVALLIEMGLSWRPLNAAGAASVLEDAPRRGRRPNVAIPPGRNPAPPQSGVKPALPQSVTITPVAMPTPTNNDYTVIKNAIEAAVSGDTIILSGTFNWTEANAAASWALGNDGTAGTLDDFSILPPADLNNITLTATSLGTATIQGPGDLAVFNLEGPLFFFSDNGTKNQGWTISNIRFLDFDTAIFMDVENGGAADAYSNTKIMNNYIRVPLDLTGTVTGGVDVSQNVGILYAHGKNQTISGNTIELQGNGMSDPGATTPDQFSAEVGMQSETSATGVYDGLQVTGNIVRVLNAQSANPERIRGIWENSHDHLANITVSDNQFINAAAGNNNALNLQSGIRVTAHSSATTTVKYQNNTVQGANIGFEWLAGQPDFAGNQPIQLISNAITNNGTGVKIDSGGSATLSFNRIAGNTIGLNNNTSNAIVAENNWWGCNSGPGAGGAGCAGTANSVTNTGGGSVDFNPWLVLGITAVPSTINVGEMSNLTADLTFNSDNVDTHLLGNIPNGTPVAFAGVLGTVAPANTTTTSGKATSVYTGTTAGMGSASATVDMQTVSTTITVNAAPCSITCPANITKSNDPNQCGAVVTYPAPTSTGDCGTITCTPPSGSFFPVGTTTVSCQAAMGGGGNRPKTEAPSGGNCTTITESSSQAITPLNSVSCNDGFGHTDNSYWRAFTLSSFGINGAFDVQSVDIGVEQASAGSGTAPAGPRSISKNSKFKPRTPNGGGSQPITVRIYTSSTAFPAGFPGSLTMIGSANANVADQSGTIINVPITGTAPAGSQLVVEVFTPDGTAAGNLFFIGSNAAAETGPSYLSAADCGITTPTTTAALGFPNMHIVMNVNGCEQASGTGPTCTFTVTVNDTQPPVITCPANITVATTTVTDPCIVVNFTTTASDNCPGVTVVCNPPSGSCFPVGTTTVTCTATDASGNTATCSFTVSGFNGRLQDDSEGCNNTVLFNTLTGDYRWCCHGTVFTGRGKVSKQGNTYTLVHNPADRRVLINLSAGSFPPSGNGSLQTPPGTTRCTISDRDTRNDTCLCGAAGPPASNPNN